MGESAVKMKIQMWLLLSAFCSASAAATDPSERPWNSAQRFTHGVYEQWAKDSQQHMNGVRNQMASGEWPKGQKSESTTRGDSGVLQCLPVQRYRGRYLEDAPDPDIAVCKILIYTTTEAPHLEPLSQEELFHCGHCALRGGLHSTATHYLHKARLNDTHSPSVAINYGLALQLGGNLPAAMREYEHALELDPGNDVAIKNLLWAHTVTGKGDNVGLTRKLALMVYEKSWVRLAVHIAGKARP